MSDETVITAPVFKKHETTYSTHVGGLVFCLILSVALHVIDTTIVNVALPHMQGALQATLEQSSWIVTAYITATVVFTPLVSWLSNRYGIKNIMIWAVSIFTLSSILCGLATSLEGMVAARILQGASGAPLIPLAQTSLVMNSGSMKQRAKFMALFGLGVTTGPIIGPTLGGYITDYLDWRWVFFVNIPVGIVAIVGLSMFMKKLPPAPIKPLNMFGFVTLALCVASFQLMMDRGETLDWLESPEIVIYLLFFVCTLWLFLVQMTSSKRPFFPRELFLDRSFLIGALIYFLTAGIMTASVVLQPAMLMQLMNYPIIDTGLLLLPRAIGTMIGIVSLPQLLTRWPTRPLMVVAALFIIFGTLPFAYLPIQSPAGSMIYGPFFSGLGIGMLFIGSNTMIYETIADKLRVEAAVVFNLLRGIGSALYVSILIAVVSRTSQIAQTDMSENVTEFSAMRLLDDSVTGSLQNGLLQDPIGYGMTVMTMQKQAGMIAYNNAYLLLSLSGLLLLAFIIMAKDRPISN